MPAVQHALGHDNATTTLNTYAHLWPTDEEQLRAAVADELSRIVGVEDHDARTALRAED